ncbi:bifunctional 2-polyprenyl-6-hydroxyphenol methylase/3-demethylubiquinol 3-O-methyltransferase UbiG [Thiomicrospira sp. WB1]|uniref:class I SAM-dependent methyltransferase n=1 Tax=Thiomicrospira sp. WB1 TaxID=1685380 RepID=UPI00074683CD|nr:class I SAM-dependent methyltransferase [Thiomicrospira sp. WB1]KUJ71205.1 tellurite resistance protein TehB [Thiomicrospira sp. WB1]
MSDSHTPSSLAAKWDRHYAEIDPARPVAASWVLQNHLDQLPFKGQALDLACGLGGNARLLAQCGLQVEAWDISEVALKHLNNWAAVHRLPIQVSITDLNQMLLPFERFDVITVSHYLDRTLWPQIVQAVKPGGQLWVQTFLAPVQANGPRHPDFYLQPGELQALPDLPGCTDLRLELYGQGWLGEIEHQTYQAWSIYQRKRP